MTGLEGRSVQRDVSATRRDTPTSEPRRVKAPEPLVVSWRGRQVRVRHDDPHLGPYTPRGAVIPSAMELASHIEGLRLYLVTALGDRYTVRVADDGSVIGLWRRTVT
jgi:hypothetical protein